MFTCPLTLSSENTVPLECGVSNVLSLRLLVCPFQMLLEVVKAKTQLKKLQCLIIRYIVQCHSLLLVAQGAEACITRECVIVHNLLVG